MQDKVGQDIIPGVIIAYGSLLGRCGALKLAKVLSTKESVVPSWNNSYNNSTPFKTKYRITVHAVEKSWRHNGDLTLAEKKSTLQFPDRCVVLVEDRLSPELRKLFDQIKI